MLHPINQPLDYLKLSVRLYAEDAVNKYDNAVQTATVQHMHG